MKRTPILHIRRDDLTVVLNKILPDNVAITKVVDKLYDVAKREKFQLKSMYRFEALSKTKKRGDRVLNAENTKVEIFNRLLAGIRTEQRVKGVTKLILQTDKEYVVLKEITALAIDFHEQSGNNSLEQSFIFFIKVGIELMRKKYALSKFKYYKDKIYDRHVVQLVINKDNAPELSKKFYAIWKRIVKGYAPDYIDIESEEDYANIVLARMEADEMKATYDDWITSQFEGLSFLDVIPNFNQLYGINAKKLYQEYVNNKSYKRKEEVSEVIDIDFETDEQKRYFEMLRSSRAD